MTQPKAPSTASERRRLDAARDMLRHVAERLDADAAAELWNGEIVPLGKSARDDIRIVFRSSDAVRRLMFSPTLMTVCELFAVGDLDIVGGSPLQLLDRWDHLKARNLSRSVDRARMLRLALPFVFGRGRKSATAAFDGAVAGTRSAGRDDRQLISFHYDVSNDFYGLFLGAEQVYSCAYYATPEAALDEAQAAQLDRICHKLRIAPGDRMLDIGCGWGGLACHAAKIYGAKVHAVTLSQQQFDFVQAKLARLGLAKQVKLEMRDYRSIERKAQYDRIAQIEMFEHVGHDNHDDHFLTVHRLLRPRGTYLHQATTRRATRDIAAFDIASPYVKVIRRFIFPGGDLDHIGRTTTNLERLGFEVHDTEALREHYVLTLREWERRLFSRRDEAIRLAGPDRTRLWLIYFAMFAKAFERGTTASFQTLATRRQTGASSLPLVRTV